MLNVVPAINGETILLRRPRESDVMDYFNVETSLELIRMYGGNTQQISSKTMEDAHKFIQSIQANKMEWCIEFEGKMVGQARITVNEMDNRARYAVGLFDLQYGGRDWELKPPNW